MTKTTREAIDAMTESVLGDLAVVWTLAGDASAAQLEALAGIETFIAIGLRVFAKTNPGKLRDVMRTVEIVAWMRGAEVIE
jgi:hypothetical protein